MSELYAVGGKTIYIGGVLATKKADFTLSDFASQVWTEIDGWETHGAIGDTAALISTDLINRRRTIKQKGNKNAGSMANNFAIMDADAGQDLLRAAALTDNNYAFKIEGDDDYLETGKTVTMTIASPGVMTATAHGYVNGNKVIFSTTDTLPTGLTAGTAYYVVSATANTFSVALTAGGSAIVTTGSQTGTHTVTRQVDPSERYFIALVMGVPEQGGTANTIDMISTTLEINSNIVPN